jgi:hypothetical protein
MAGTNLLHEHRAIPGGILLNPRLVAGCTVGPHGTLLQASVDMAIHAGAQALHAIRLTTTSAS